jgi:hypothetical protein
MDYYYLAAQLPSLIYGQPLPMSSKSYRELCQTQLSPQDYSAMEGLAVGGKVPPELLAGDPSSAGGDFCFKWRQWNQACALNLAKYRAQKQKSEGAGSGGANALGTIAPDFPAGAANAAKTAAGMDNPLEAELSLDKARWEALSDLEGLDPFGLNKLYSYLLKLELMERRQAFNAEKGFTEYQRLYNTILDKAAGPGENK